MDSWISWVCTVIALAIAFFHLCSNKRYKLPPGPFSFPVVGSLFSVGQNRHRSLARLSQKYGPVMFLKLGSRPHVVISSPGMAKQVLKDHDLAFASRPQFHTFFRIVSHGFNNLAFAPHGERWKLLRRISGMELFTPARVKHFSGIRIKEFAVFGSTVARCAEGGRPFDLTALLHELFTNLMTSVLFGKKFYSFDESVMPEAEGYRAFWETFIREAERFYIGDFIPALRWIDKLKRSEYKLKNEALPAVDHFLQTIINEHKEGFQANNPPRDFIDVLFSLEGEKKLDDQTIIALLENLLLAGTNTSRGTVEWGISEIIRSPHAQQKAHEELDRVIGRNRNLEESDLNNLPYIQAIVKEVMRLHPIAPTGLPHSNPEAVELAGYTIPANTTVIVNLWAIQRDPSTWKDPESFLPERFLGSDDHNVLGQNFDFIPFGSGRRRCVGLPLAMPHVTLAIAHLLHRFEWRMPLEEEIDMEEATGLAAMPSKHRIVCAIARN